MTVLERQPGGTRWPGLGACHDGVWLGGARMLDWCSSAGTYRFYEVGRSRRARVPMPVRQDVWPRRVGHRFAWLGGDDVLEWKPAVPRYTVWRYVTPSAQGKRGEPLDGPVASGTWKVEGSVTSVGRGTLLALDASAGRARILRWRGHDMRERNIPVDAAVRKWLAAQERRWLRVAWLGADRVLAWNVASGASLALRWGRRLRAALPRDGADGGLPNLKGFGLAYVGGDTLLGWQREPPAGGKGIRGSLPVDCFRPPRGVDFIDDGVPRGPGRRWDGPVWHVGLNPAITADIADYLDLHRNVQGAIAWPVERRARPILYADWDLETPTVEFNAALSRLYLNLEDGVPLEFSFRADGERPALERPGGSTLSTRDASEIFLAHVAQSLRVEIARTVPWKLHEYASTELPLILNGVNMFVPGTSEQNLSGRYRMNIDRSGVAMPMDPIRSHIFLTTQGLLRASARDTIFELGRWVRDHLLHGAGPAAGQGQMPWLDTMLVRTVDASVPMAPARFWTWFGCHSAAALFVWLMRVVNVPGQAAPTSIENEPLDSSHNGVDWPTERLFVGHTDDFYAIPPLMDPTIEPSEIYTTADVYEPVRALYTSPGDNRATTYSRRVALIGLDHPTFYFVDAYWNDEFARSINPSVPSRLEDILATMGFGASEVAALAVQYAPALAQAVATFKAGRPASESDWASLQAYEAEYNAWLAAH